MPEPETQRIEIAGRLRAAREQSGLSQGQVAEMMRLQRPTVSEIEAGRRKVSAEEIAQFARIYEVSVSWLLNAESEVADPAVELAARGLAKLQKEDLESVLRLLKTLRASENNRQ